MRILLVEDDLMIGRSLDSALSATGLAIDWVKSAADCRLALAAYRYEMFLLDLGLPDETGLDLLKGLRQSGETTPALIISARDDVASRIAGLDLGADDYVVKPFDVEELNARIRAVTRRRNGQTTSQISGGEVTLDLARNEVTYRNACHVLPPREFALLRALVDGVGTILSRRQIEDRLYDWGNEVDSNAVDVLIHYVRRRFDKDIVRNVRGVGWMIAR